MNLGIICHILVDVISFATITLQLNCQMLQCLKERGLSIQDGLCFISSIHLIQKMGIYMGELFRVLNYKSNGNLCFGWSLMEINGENLVEYLDVVSCGIIDGESSWCILLVRSLTEKLDHQVIFGALNLCCVSKKWLCLVGPSIGNAEVSVIVIGV